ncbi:PiT family inorganic phosphate transporter [Mariniflexile fucanivorans]|uniref:Phosphate transporter n=1 Tax=Mariniflexile fucanivorans TaxID=264023 RepID=A0A4V2QDX7_9FLAO|nr:inorganic phosphate transporter [Mariniflexile fucanivorans]TCL65677.1 PiT family inorganic phosphate transporter [Mariniflexile fucanivorans]
MILIFLFLAACFLAFSNGANDNFKGVATLFGSGTTNYKGAITWATLTTISGSIAAIFFASTLVKNFSGKGLVPDTLIQSPEFAISIALGAAITVFFATKIGMPISTTHSLVGALFGSGMVAVGASFNFAKLGGTFLMPLIVSPLMAAIVSLVTYTIFRKLRINLGVTKKTCICVGKEYIPITKTMNFNGLITVEAETQTGVRISNEQECIERYQGDFIGINSQKMLDLAHYLSAGIVSFARGLNDTPKIVGLLIVINTLDVKWGMLTVAIAMALGGLLNAKKVGEMMSKKITPMNSGQGFTANLITGLLVTTASIHGLPVSTTHVSVGSIFGIGTVTKKADFKVIQNILLSWLLTLPIAAICSAIIYWLLLKIN